MKKKKWWLGVTENGGLEIKYLVSPIRQPWVFTKSATKIDTLLDYVEEKLGIDPRAVKGLPPWVFGKKYSKKRR